MGLVFWSMGAISPRLYTVPFQQEPALGQWSLVILGTTVTSSVMSDAHGEVYPFNKTEVDEAVQERRHVLVCPSVYLSLCLSVGLCGHACTCINAPCAHQNRLWHADLVNSMIFTTSRSCKEDVCLQC